MSDLSANCGCGCGCGRNVRQYPASAHRCCCFPASGASLPQLHDPQHRSPLRGGIYRMVQGLPEGRNHIIYQIMKGVNYYGMESPY